MDFDVLFDRVKSLGQTNIYNALLLPFAYHSYAILFKVECLKLEMAKLAYSHTRRKKHFEDSDLFEGQVFFLQGQRLFTMPVKVAKQKLNFTQFERFWQGLRLFKRQTRILCLKTSFSAALKNDDVSG